MTKELIENIRTIIVPYMAHDLRRINYENMGEIDAEQFKEDMNEILDLATKALQQQPCEDAISRQAVLDKIKEVCFSTEKEWVDFRVSYGSNGQRDFIVNFIESLPSIQPKPKTGHWIPSHIPESILDECSECGFSCGAFTFNYCPNCGAKMESEES